MLMGMLRKFSERADFLHEDEGNYSSRIDHEQEHEHDYDGRTEG